MQAAIRSLRAHPLFVPVLIVPTLITLIFSLFNLTAAPDPARLAAALRIGVVNDDAGMTFPPIKVAARMIDGMGDRLPFTLAEQPDEAAGRAALEAGALTALLIFPESFTGDVLGDGNVGYRLILAENLPAAEAQVAGQLPTMLDTAMSAAVSSIRLSLAKGQLPNPTLPVAGEIERLYPITLPAQRMAPFAAVFTTWLAALIGALLLTVATRPMARDEAALLRTAIPVAVTGVAALTLALLVAATAGVAGGAVTLWLSAWALMLALSWAFGGLFAWHGPAAMLLLLPVAFYQAALGGAQIPPAAAPAWLQSAALGLPFDRVGALYRSLILGGPGPDWLPLALGLAAAGLVLIWARTLLGRPAPLRA
jgi:ABC-2 type transport system permease protein